MTDLRASFTPDIHRMLPQSPDAEMGVLASLILAPTEVFQLCEESGITENTFHIPAHQKVYSAVREIIESTDAKLDFIRLTQSLRDKQQLDSVGGAGFVSSLFTYLPTASNAVFYIKTVCEKAKLREIIQTGTEYAARAYEETEPEALIAGLESRVLLMTETATKKADEKSNKQLALEVVSDIQTLYANRGKITGISTGFDDLDKLTNGLQPEEMSVFAARPSVGKTAFGLNMAEHIAINEGIPTVIFSLEMSQKQLMSRLIHARAKINAMRVRDGYLSDAEFSAISAAAATFGACNHLHIIDTGENGRTIQKIRSKSRQLANKFRKAGHTRYVFVIDYLQLVTSSSKRASNGNREQEVAEVSGSLKMMSKELKCPVVVMAQVNRASAKEKRRPKISDLRESGSIEQDADNVFLIGRPEMELEKDDPDIEAVHRLAEVDIGKQRNGPIELVRMTFWRDFARFENGWTQPQIADENKGRKKK